jgi:hypothetical protein
MKSAWRVAVAGAWLAVVTALPTAAAAEQVYAVSINNWAAADSSGEMDITWRAQINTAGTRTSTASVGKICMNSGGKWAWKDASQPLQIKQLVSTSDRSSGVARIKAAGTWSGSSTVTFWAIMGTECGSSAAAESNVVNRTLKRN